MINLFNYQDSVNPNLVVPPHSGEKSINKVREAGKVINKGYQTQLVPLNFWNPALPSENS